MKTIAKSLLPLFILSSCSTQVIVAKGMVSNKLAPCKSKPNCVSSFDKRDSHYIGSLNLKMSESEIIEKVIILLKERTDVEVITVKEGYIHAVFTTPLLKFKDDVEFLIIKNTIHFRSESRVGYSDFGTNRKRIEEFKDYLKKKF
ncbi:DUF1499 domain-containing protein [Bacteriovorax sp. DB6_IX]|uniref:DUF1499 domain-containing protein n=1 Tax=Bacteriovorax sp. DB6_IX TaxID=1353530 RepID=UPI00038A12F2|nr:DUF1499 domain-containing protein [Bacteriovorax sp. DB6_IX]EQC51317.1 PF07386 family protein [Bacteriovorax sp. DB6_IX]